MRLYMRNKITRRFSFENLLTQTQGRTLTTLSIFKLKRNMQKHCLCGCFTCFTNDKLMLLM